MIQPLKEGNFANFYNINGPGDIEPSELSQRKADARWYHLYVESKKQNWQAEQKQTHRYREHFDSCQIEEGLGGWVKKVKGLRSTNW